MNGIKLFVLVFFLVFATIFTGCKKKESAKPTAGTIENGVYNNEYFGLTLELPKEWSIQDEEANKELSEFGYKMIAGDDENMEKSLKAAAENQQIMFFSASRYPVGTPVADNPNIIATAELIKSKPGIARGSDFR